MDLPLSGKILVVKSIQDSRETPDRNTLPLRDQGLGVINRLQRLYINDETFNGKMLDAKSV